MPTFRGNAVGKMMKCADRPQKSHYLTEGHIKDGMAR